MRLEFAAAIPGLTAIGSAHEPRLNLDRMPILEITYSLRENGRTADRRGVAFISRLRRELSRSEGDGTRTRGLQRDRLAL